MPGSLEGLGGLRNLVDLTATTVGDLKEANREGAGVVLDAAGPKIRSRSGDLERSGRASGTKRAGVVRYGRAKVPYAAAYHFGHFNREQGGFMRPHPFLYDALDERSDEVVARYEKFVERALSRIG